MVQNCLVFGASGSVGNYIFNEFHKLGMNVVGTTTNKDNISENIIYITSNDLTNLSNLKNITIVVWAQGYNINDNIHNYDNNIFNSMLEGNVTFIMNTLNYLLTNNIIIDNSKMVITSSIWQELSRENKLSYSISKSALNGLIKNVAFDLAKRNILINNILPGVIDNIMTRKTLISEQLEYVKSSTNFNRLITLDDIYKTILFLVTENTGITGQSIKIDLGFTNIKNYH
jgi:NAD(P)-dependent dehydrogenase (short-subunit alcohol dehydrogenase family)